MDVAQSGKGYDCGIGLKLSNQHVEIYWHASRLKLETIFCVLVDGFPNFINIHMM